MRKFVVEYKLRIQQQAAVKLTAARIQQQDAAEFSPVVIAKLTHQDLGQMQMYVNHYDRKVKLPQENPTIGILLCKRKKDAIVELTLPLDANVHTRECKLYLPSKAELKRKLLEWTEEQG